MTNCLHMLLTNSNKILSTAATNTCSFDEVTKTAKWSEYGPDLSDCYLSVDYLIQQLYAGKFSV